MRLPDLLAELQQREIQIWVDGDRLRCSGPIGVITPDLRQRMQQHKAEILEFLRTAQAVAQHPAIVPLQPHGVRMPVFGVGGHNGDAFTYRPLAQVLGDDQPFFGLRPPGLDANSQPIDRVEDLATYFANQIQSFRPKGPYVIAGYCAGGSIAFELAQQLERRGAKVAFVAMFGCPYPTLYRHMKAKLLPGRLLARARGLASLSSLAEFRDYAVAVSRPLRQAITAAVSPAPPPDEVAILRTRVEETTVAAVRRYLPSRFTGRVNLFLPNRKWQRSPCRPLRWQSLAEHTEVYFGPEECQWDSMLMSPSVSAIAELFKAARDGSGDPADVCPPVPAAAGRLRTLRT